MYNSIVTTYMRIVTTCYTVRYEQYAMFIANYACALLKNAL